MTVKESFDEYLQFQDLRANTIAAYGRAVDFFIELFGDMEIEKVTPRQAVRYKIALKAERGLKKSSPNAYLRNIKAYYKWVAVEKKIDNPFSRVKLYRKEEVIRPIYSTEDIERIYSVSDLRESVVFTLVLCGMRRGELLNIVVKDIDYENSRIKVTAKELTETTWPSGIKGKSERFVGLPAKGVNLIANLQDTLSGGQPYVVLKPKHYQAMLKRIETNNLTQNSCDCPWPAFNRWYSRLLKKAGVDHRRPHDGRATLCMKLLDNNMPLPMVKDAMGHKSIQTTVDYYVRYSKEQTANEAGKILNNII